MTTEDAVYTQMEKVGELRGYSGKLRGAIVVAVNSLKIGDPIFALRTLEEALTVQNPDRPVLSAALNEERK